MAHRSWSQLSPRTRRLFIVLGVVEAALSLAAQIDLTRRSADQVNGSKRLWRLMALVNFVGPIAYFVKGRRTSLVP